LRKIVDFRGAGKFFEVTFETSKLRDIRVCVLNCGASNDVHDVESQRVNDCEQSHRRDGQ